MSFTRVHVLLRSRLVLYGLIIFVSWLLLWLAFQLANAATTYIVDVGANVVSSDTAVINGSPAFAYFDGATQTIKVAICSNPACETGTSSINSVVSGDSSVRAVKLLDASGDPFIVYSDPTQIVAVACNDALCSSSLTITPIASIDSGGLLQAATEVNNNPLIIYTETYGSPSNPRESMIAIACADPQCSTPVTTTTLYDDWGVYWGTHFQAGFTDNFPIIAFVHNSELKLAVCANLACTGVPYWRELDTDMETLGQKVSMTLLNGNPVIAYLSSVSSPAISTKIAACSDPTCQNAPTISTLNIPANDVSAANVAGTLMIAYIPPGVSAPLDLSTCQDDVCSSVTTVSLPISGDNKGAIQLVDAGGDAAISFVSNTSNMLSYYYGGEYSPTGVSTPSFTPSNTPLPPTSTPIPPSNTPPPPTPTPTRPSPTPSATPRTVTPSPTVPTPISILPVDSSTQVLQSNVDVGKLAMELNHEGFPVIAYDHNAGGPMALVECDNGNCDAPVTRTVGPGNGNLLLQAFALTSEDVPLVAYLNASGTTYHLELCGNTTCDMPVITTLNHDVGLDTLSITVDRNDIPWFSYYDTYYQTLTIVQCNDGITCDSPTYMTVPDTSHVAYFTPILLMSATNLPIIAYYDYVSNMIKIAFCNNSTTCSNPSVYAINTGNKINQMTSMKLDNAGRPVIGYSASYSSSSYLDRISFVRCNSSAACDHPTSTIVDTVAESSFMGPLTLDANGLPVIVYMDGERDYLTVARCTTFDCNAPVIGWIDTSRNASNQTGIAMDSNNEVFVSYGRFYNSTTDDFSGDLLLYMGGPLPSNLPVTPTAPPDAPPQQNYFTMPIVTLTWTRVVNAVGYQLQIDDAADFQTPLYTVDSLSPTILSYSTQPLSNGTYYWRICAKIDANICGSWSATQSFVVSAAP